MLHSDGQENCLEAGNCQMLQQRPASSHHRSLASFVTHHGARNYRQLGEERGRQTERR